jgi:hypothetical protein
MEGWEDTEKNRDTVLLQLKELKKDPWDIYNYF